MQAESRIVSIRKLTKTDLFRRHLRLAYSQAHKFANQYQRPHHEMVDEAVHALGKVIAEWDKFDPNKSRPITHIYHAVYWHLMKTCQPRQRKHTQTPADPSVLDRQNCRKEPSWYQRIWMDLGTEGRAFLKIVVEAPGDLYYSLSPRAPASARQALLRYLREEGWKGEDIHKAMKQVEFCL